MVRYHCEKREGDGPWESYDMKAGHQSYGFARRLAVRAKEQHGWKTRVKARVVTVEEFVVEEF